MRVGEQVKVKGNLDRRGSKIPDGPWFIWLINKPAVVISNGQYWLAGQIYSGKSNYPPFFIHGDDALLWETEKAARENHEERMAGEVA